MPTFFIIPPRKIVASGGGGNVVTSLNTLTGAITLQGSSSIDITPSGNTLIFSVPEDLYVLKDGDTYTGNLRFIPTGGRYGLQLAVYSANPGGSADVGAMYFNDSDNTIKIYNLGIWQTLAITGALTEATANALYLRLDGTNDPITGDLDLGTVKLRVGRKASDPGGGVTGDFYYNTGSNKLRLYNGSSWVNVAEGVTSITAGAGLTGGTITTTGTIAIDYTQSPTWGGTHTFSNPIVFSGSQTFAITGLTIGGQTDGDLIRRSGGAWGRLGVGSPGQVLRVVGSAPTWSDETIGGSGAAYQLPIWISSGAQGVSLVRQDAAAATATYVQITQDGTAGDATNARMLHLGNSSTDRGQMVLQYTGSDTGASAHTLKILTVADATDDIAFQIVSGGTLDADGILDGGSAVASIDGAGNLVAITKSFNIPHPIRSGERLVYGCLEGPEHGVYARGSAQGLGCVEVELPLHWAALVNGDYTVLVTPRCSTRLCVKRKTPKSFEVSPCGLLRGFRHVAFDYVVIGSRVDAPLVVEPG